MASTDDIYKILLDVNTKLGAHSERFDAIDEKLTPIIEKVTLHDRAIIAVSAAGALVVMIGGLFIGGIKAAIAAIVTHGG